MKTLIAIVLCSFLSLSPTNRVAKDDLVCAETELSNSLDDLNIEMDKLKTKLKELE